MTFCHKDLYLQTIYKRKFYWKMAVEVFNCIFSCRSFFRRRFRRISNSTSDIEPTRVSSVKYVRKNYLLKRDFPNYFKCLVWLVNDWRSISILNIDELKCSVNNKIEISNFCTKKQLETLINSKPIFHKLVEDLLYYLDYSLENYKKKVPIENIIWQKFLTYSVTWPTVS